MSLNNLSKKNIIDELEDKRKIIKLQQKYEAGKIKEEELSEVQKKELLNLYQEQISTLEGNIILYKRKLKLYKKKISEKMEKMKFKNKKGMK